MYQELLIIIVSLVISAFFSSIEAAFIAANKLYFEVQKKQGVASGKIIAGFFQKPTFFLTTIFFCNLLAFIVYGIYSAIFLQPAFAFLLPDFLQYDLLIIVLQILFSTVTFLLCADYLLKYLFLLNPDHLLEMLSYPLQILYLALYPLIYVFVNVSKYLLTNVFGLPYSEDKPVFKWKDLDNYIGGDNTQSDNPEQEEEIDTKIFSNALLFKNVKIRDCMIPRTEIIAVGIHESIEVLKKVFVETGLSKILIYKENIDEIIGYCHSLDLFKSPKNIESILIGIIIVPEITPAQELLASFIAERKSIAQVTDEFGGTAGIVTLEDVMEEIFGDIQDENDEEILKEEKTDEENYILSARHEIKYLNEKYAWNIPEGDYDTLGGFIVSIRKNIPQLDEVILFPPFTFTILSIEYSRIDTVKLHIDKIQHKTIE